MADATNDSNTDFEDEDAELESKSRFSRKKLLLIGGAAVILVLGGGLVTYSFMGSDETETDAAGDGADAAKNAAKGGKHAAQTPASDIPANTTVFYDLPEILVNIDTGGRKKTFLKLKLSVELGNETDIPPIESVLPKIVDNFQIYLRDLKPNQLEGSAGTFRIREELLVRVNAAVRPVQVKDVLVKEMLLQ